MKPRTFGLVSAGVAALAFLVSGPALAQPRFRIVDLTNIGFIPDDDVQMGSVHGTVAINNWGQVVYARDVGGQLQAWVSVPEPAFGQTKGIHDLNDLFGFDGSAAWDINMSGQIVGQKNGSVLREGQAIVWQLDSTVSVCALGFLPDASSPGEWSVAYAINDATPTVIVGEGNSELSGCDSTNAAFRAEFVGMCGPMGPVLQKLPLSGIGIDFGTYARDINTNPNEQITGFSWLAVRPSFCFPGEEACDAEKDPMRWLSNTAGLALNRLLMTGGGHEARGNNNSGQIVGVGFDLPGGSCLKKAVFWQDDTALAFSLHSDIPMQFRLPIGEQSHAEAINDRFPIQVVGKNLTTGHALLWEQDIPGGWDNPVVDLDAAVDDPDSVWVLREAHDINDLGCIVGWGNLLIDAVVEQHVFLLYENCPADCADEPNDALVAVPDLLALLGAWGGPQTPGTTCDIDGDGVIAVPDLLALLGAWGPCCRVGSAKPPLGGAPPDTIEQAIVDAGLDYPEDWDIFMNCITNGTPEEADNCNCWMHHYLHGDCNGGPMCPHPECSGEDPFDGPHLGI